MRPPFLIQVSIFDVVRVCTFFVLTLQLSFFSDKKQQDRSCKLFRTGKSKFFDPKNAGP